MNRRELNTLALAAGATLMSGGLASAAPSRGPAARTRPLQVALVMYPGFFIQDLVGPYAVFATMPDTQVHLVSGTADPVTATPGALPIRPTATYETCPKDLDVIMMPGAALPTVAAMQDQKLLAFLRDRADRARFVTSVCTGSLILGAAGLLKGYRATSHWLTTDALADFGAIHTPGRVVVDRNRVTGGGVTAGIDFGFTVAALLIGKERAEMIQLITEYNPEPPFRSGSPDTAPPEITAQVRKTYGPFAQAIKVAAGKIAAQPGF